MVLDILISVVIALLFQLPQSLSIPMIAPTHCVAGQTTPCVVLLQKYGLTAIIVAKGSGPSIGNITDSLGTMWTRDFCTDYDNGNCLFHAQFNYGNVAMSDILTFPSGGYSDVYILQYEGTWNFVIGQQGTYAQQNYPFPDCAATDGGCPYNWTNPVEPDAGNLLIAYSVSNNSIAVGIPKPGLGYNIEANDGLMAVEDMVAPIGGVPYIGSLTWTNLNSHWIMGIGVYARQ